MELHGQYWSSSCNSIFLGSFLRCVSSWWQSNKQYWYYHIGGKPPKPQNVSIFWKSNKTIFPFVYFENIYKKGFTKSSSTLIFASVSSCCLSNLHLFSRWTCKLIMVMMILVKTMMPMMVNLMRVIYLLCAAATCCSGTNKVRNSGLGPDPDLSAKSGPE